MSRSASGRTRCRSRAAPRRSKLVERRGEVGGVQVRNVIAPGSGLALIVFTDRPFDFGEAWQGKGGSFDLFSAAFCPEQRK